MEKNNKGQRVIPVKDLKKDQVIHQVQQVWTKQQEEIHLASMILVDSHVKAIWDSHTLWKQPSSFSSSAL